MEKSSEAGELPEVMELLMTMREKKMMCERIEIVIALLEEKLTQREIAQKYGHSISQITAGSKAVQRLKDKTRNFVKDTLC
jgi:TrpR family trp operon transcriptional repressor